ncbi:MAG TPA: hypothetical protein VJ724_01115, partial [Tahibacter sp.]|nr:hypothetical protein [Tahibacter sp.]
TLKAGAKANASLATSSPGLVLASLGVGLVALAVLTQSEVNLDRATSPTPTFEVVGDKAD